MAKTMCKCGSRMSKAECGCKMRKASPQLGILRERDWATAAPEMARRNAEGPPRKFFENYKGQIMTDAAEPIRSKVGSKGSAMKKGSQMGKAQSDQKPRPPRPPRPELPPRTPPAFRPPNVGIMPVKPTPGRPRPAGGQLRPMAMPSDTNKAQGAFVNGKKVKSR